MSRSFKTASAESASPGKMPLQRNVLGLCRTHPLRILLHDEPHVCGLGYNEYADVMEEWAVAA